MALAERWGTWEELVLGSAVLRHGTADWDTVASELRSRTRSRIPLPHFFTAQVCEAKYNDLQVLYSGCHAWFEELRKRRVAELRKELAKTEDSIGSLESKLESLIAVKESHCINFDYDISRTQSISPVGDADYSCKDGLSAGSLTSNKVRESTPECEITASVSLQDDGTNIRSHDNNRIEKAVNLCSHLGHPSYRRKRGMRKRRFFDIFKEDSLGQSESASSDAKFDPEEPAAVLAGILDSISKDKDSSILQCRIEKQAPSQPKKKLRRVGPCNEEKALAARGAIERGELPVAPARNGRPPKGCWSGGRGRQADSVPWRKKASA